MGLRVARTIGAVALAGATLLAAAGTAGATATRTAEGPAFDAGQRRDGERALVLAGHNPGPATSIAERSSRGRTTLVHSNVVVTYHGFPSNARAAFAKAAAIWSTLVASDVTIRVDATWSPLGEGILGGASEYSDFKNFTGAPRPNVWYPSALADARAKKDLEPGQPDIVAEFSSDSSLWYLGTDGQAPLGRYDLTSVVLHELGHGLGFAGTTEVDNTDTYARYGGGTGLPAAYDRLVQTGGGTPITSIANESTAMHAALTSNSLYLGGTNAKAANGGQRPRLYAPSTWEQGSSVAHLDEGTYGQGNLNSLMTPYLNDGESVHDPGDIVLGTFQDIGWKTATKQSAPGAPKLTAAYTGSSRAIVAWAPPTDTGRLPITGYRIRRYVGSASTPDQTIDVTGSTLSRTFLDVTNGTTYHYSVAAKNVLGIGPATPLSASLKPFDSSPFADAQVLTTQQYQDVLGRAPSASELSSGRVSLSNGSTGPSALIVSLLAKDSAVAPVVRLYEAYFERAPDHGGLTYWAGKIRAGGSLSAASSSFAGSSEFKAKYGTLSNGAFVKLVYQNVLGRQPDAAGLDYWTKKLNAGTSRGAVMIGFSESAEMKARTLHEVQVIQVYVAMLRRMPTSSELTNAVSLLDGGTTTITQVVANIYASPAYRDRF